MAWVKVDTSFATHPKTLQVGPLGEALWLRGLCYAADHLTDGFVPDTFLKRMGDLKATPVAAKLVAVGLWERVEGGYQIHDYLVWQRSRDEVERLSQTRAEAGRLGGNQRASNAQANVKQSASKVSSKIQADKNREEKNREDTEDKPPLPPKGDGGVKPRIAPKYTPDFEAFWYLYPSGHGAKYKAFTEWQRIPEGERPAVTDGLIPWTQCELWNRGFIKHADVWLRNRMWEDVPPPPKPVHVNGNGRRSLNDELERAAADLNRRLGLQ